MGHITSKNYRKLQRRLDRSPQGAPESATLFKILEILFTEKEAGLVSVLPINFFTAKKAADIWETTETKATEILNGLADKAILLDMINDETQNYVLAPTMAGFFEFSLMRTDGRFDSKALSELYKQYINTEEGFMRTIFSLDPAIDRVFVQEGMIAASEDSKIVLDYERASHIIETASSIAVGTCYCRHKMSHAGDVCKNPMDVCLTFNTSAYSLSKHGVAREIEKAEAKDVIKLAIDHHLVQIGDNVQNSVNWICNCCSCCCEAILAYRKLGYSQNIQSNYRAVLNQANEEKCNGCGICVKRCPVDAIVLTGGKDGDIKKGDTKTLVDDERCLGCGVCANACPQGAMTMVRLEEINFVPKDTFERFALAAIETGKLQNFIFDNHHLWTYELLRRLLKLFLTLGPVKRRLVDKELQSRYFNRMVAAYHLFNKDTSDIEIDFSD